MWKIILEILRTVLLSALVDYNDYMFEMGEDMDLYYDIAQKKMFVLEVAE